MAQHGEGKLTSKRLSCGTGGDLPEHELFVESRRDAKLD